jgi:hypothetical protein
LTRWLPLLVGLVLAALVFALPAGGVPTVSQVTDCTRTGAVPVAMDLPDDETPSHFSFKVNDGAEQQVATTDERGTLQLPSAEGRYKLEYWGNTTGGADGGEGNHVIKDAVFVDRTNPNVSVESDQNKSLYVIKRKASVSVEANDSLSGLTGDPSAQSQTVGTGSRGKQVVERSAVDLCGNTTTQRFEYTVLGPVLGRLAVIEPLGTGARVRPAARGGSAAARNEARSSVALREPREIPIGSLINARRARVRITNSRSRVEGNIQAGTFSGGLFQVRQSRRRSRRGLTELRLRGSSFRNCLVGGASRAGTSRSGEVAETARRRRRLSRRTRRRLRGRARGRYRTRGRRSSATVRGTIWTVADRCDGTLTTVRSGRVAVRDFRRRRTIILRRGKRYLARARR